MPLGDTNMYTAERVKKGLYFADCTLRNETRKISPIGHMALVIYKDACARLLQLENENDLDKAEAEVLKRQWIASIRSYEQSIQYNAALQATSSDSAEVLKDKLLQLQRVNFYARYGDFFSEVCRRLRDKVNALSTDGHKAFEGKYWTEVSRKLKREEEFYEVVLAGKPEHKRCPLHMAISQACQSLGFTFDDTIAMVHYYGQRNELLHTNWLPLIRDADYSTMAEILHRDFCQVRLIMPPEFSSSADLMLRVIEGIIDEWFIRDEDFPDNPKGWSASDSLKAYAKKLRGGKEVRDEAKIYEGVTEQVVESINKRKSAAEKDREMAEFLENFTLTAPAMKVKRVASTQLQSEEKRIKLADNAFKALVNISNQAMKMKEAYIAKYPDYLKEGQLSAPPERVEKIPD